MGLLQDWQNKAFNYLGPRVAPSQYHAIEPVQNDVKAAGASEAHNDTVPWASGGNAQPVAPNFNSILNPDGTLKADYMATAPEHVGAKQVTSGGTLTPGNVSFRNILKGPDVGFKSILPDATSNYASVLGAKPEGDMAAYRSRALSTDIDPTTANAIARQRMDESNNLDLAQRKASGASANAEASLAMRGGLSGGAQERLAAGGAQNAMDAAQDVRRQGASDRLGLEGNDAAMKLNLLQGLPAADLAWMQPEMHVADVKTGIAGDERNLGVSTDLSNRDYNTGVDKFNTTTGLDRDKYNETNNMEAGRFNILNNQDVQKTNVTNNLAADEYNNTGAYNARLANINTRVGGNTAENVWNANTFNQNMAAWGAGKTADATGAAAKNGKK